jgi:hypothetical protein
MAEAPTLDMYNASVPALLRVLKSATILINKAKDFAAEKKAADATVLGARLALDMFPFARQIQIVTDNCKGAAARLGGVDVPSYDDTEVTFDELLARVQKTTDFVSSIDEANIKGSESKTIVLKLGPNEVTFTGHSYLTSFVLPNVYFHLTTAYGILRSNGVVLSKSDYLV